tara:strand:+ start:151 stop:318 length:168 start_codon:yes stop_codon:yes gene_type:complete
MSLNDEIEPAKNDLVDIILEFAKWQKVDMVMGWERVEKKFDRVKKRFDRLKEHDK